MKSKVYRGNELLLMQLKNFSLDQIDDFISKSALCNLLKISSRTMYEYHQLAMLIPDFEADYPCVRSGSVAITSCQLTKYQCWVIVSLLVISKRLRRSNVYECLLNGTNPDFTDKFSKTNYQQLNEKIYDITAICEVA